MYARYRALLSLIVKVNRPGLLIPDLEFGSLAMLPVRSSTPAVAISRGCCGLPLRARQPPQQLFERERAIDGGQAQRTQLIGGIEQPQQCCNIHVPTGFWQVRASAQFL